MKPLSPLAALPLLQEVQCAASSFADDCNSLVENLKLDNTTVLSSDVVPAATNITFPGNHPTCGRKSQAVDVEICRVAMRSSTSATSNTSIEVWLPSDWNGRFLGTGNGGTGGCIQYEDMSYGVSQGFAAAGTNNGHDGVISEPFLNNEGVIEDFAYRALHLGAVFGQETVKAFYGEKHTKSYYLGCSTGGRQGFKEAQDFPEDFDGFVVGAPALSFPNLTSWSGNFFTTTGAPGAPTFLTADQWDAVYADILNQCDGLDGQVDGIIEDPDLCQYRPEALICGKGNSTSTCLTGTQAQTVRTIFSDLHGIDGSLVYPRMQPSEQITSLLLAGEPFDYTMGWFRNVVYNDSNWDPSTLGPEDYAVAAAQNPFNIDTWKGDLSEVRDRGGKILHYHGLQDALISSDNSARYYNHVSRTMGLTSGELDEFYRYFRISGMGHCSGGPGATFIGNGADAVAGYDAERNVLSAIVKWVEEGVAPDFVLGTAYVDGTKAGGEDFTRRHCKYPARNVYKAGDPKSADSWECV